MRKIHLVVIDGQNDFVDPKGSLSVPGAKEDMDRLVKFIQRGGTNLTSISLTLDSHHLIDIAHPSMWVNENGVAPKPFTIITKEDVSLGNWTTSLPSFNMRALEYVTQLENNGKFPLCIWPPHCLIGSWGNNIYPPLFEAILEWENHNFAIAQYISKGSNHLTEHYSALRADVPDPLDSSTQINMEFIKNLEDSDLVIISGEASSHCVANTIRDLLEFSPSMSSKVVLLKDAMSPVPGFEKFADDFFLEMADKGVMQITSTDFSF